MLVWKPYGFYSPRTDLSSVWRYVYIITFLEDIYRVCLGRVTAYKPNYAFRAFRPYASNVYDNRKRTSSYAFKN